MEVCAGPHRSQREHQIRSLEAGVTGVCKPPNMGAEIQTPILMTEQRVSDNCILIQLLYLHREQQASDASVSSIQLLDFIVGLCICCGCFEGYLSILAVMLDIITHPGEWTKGSVAELHPTPVRKMRSKPFSATAPTKHHKHFQLKEFR